MTTITQTPPGSKAKLFRGFADSARLGILETLRVGPHAVGKIVDATGLTQSNVSNHLACLKDCGLVTSERSGRRVIYALSDPRVGQLLASVDDLLADVARGVIACAAYGPTEDAARD